MEQTKINSFLKGESKWYFHFAFWAIAGFLIYFVFSNKALTPQIRFPIVLILIAFGFGASYFINKLIIPKFLFKGRTLLALYLFIGIFIITLGVSFNVIFGLVYFSAFFMPQFIIPHWEDIIIMIAGNFLIITLAAVIHFIRESFRQMAAKNEMLIQKTEAESKLKDAQLKLLQGQIHPHFLYNMLNNLYAMIRIDTNASRDTIIRISDLLDYMLYKCNEETTKLENEVQFIENYIELERIRHSGEYNVNFHYPESIKNVSIAPLILFPFVENAFKHGFRNADKGCIKISITLLNNKIQFICENSIATKPISDDQYLHQESSGIGLKNIQERLDLLYKDAYKLSVEDNEKTYKVELQLARKDD
jgi:two-component system LytT family sensor kinase